VYSIKVQAKSMVANNENKVQDLVMALCLYNKHQK